MRYILRGHEEHIIRTLTDKSLTVLLGIPGVGKTTMARYIAIKMREKGFIPLIINTQTQGSNLETITVYDESGNSHKLFQIGLPPLYNLDKEIAKLVAFAILKTISDIKNKSQGIKDINSFIDNINLFLPKYLKLTPSQLQIIKERLDEIKMNENFIAVGEIVVEIISSVILGVSLVTILERIKKYKQTRSKFKLQENVLIVLDDVSEFPSKEVLLTLVSWLKEYGARVLIVRRVDLDAKEFFQFVEETCEVINLKYINNLLWGSNVYLINSETQIFPIYPPSFREFKEIIRANLRNIPDDIKELFKASGGIPTLAILINELGISYNEEDLSNIAYYSIDTIKEEEKYNITKAKATIKIFLVSTGKLYTKIKKENFGLVALLTQPITQNELALFCKNHRIRDISTEKGYPLFYNIDDYLKEYPYGLLKIAQIKQEKWKSNYREYYELTENWLHMRHFLKTLSKANKKIKEEISIVRRVLLSIMSEELEKTNIFTGRMLIYSLEHINFILEETPYLVNPELLKPIFKWGQVALAYFPPLGFKVSQNILKILTEKFLTSPSESEEEFLIYVLSYIIQLIDVYRVSPLPHDDIRKRISIFTRILTRYSSHKPTIQSLHAISYSLLAILAQHNSIPEGSKYLEIAEEISNSIEDRYLRDITQVYVNLNAARFLLNESCIECAYEYVENTIRLIEKIRMSYELYIKDKQVIKALTLMDIKSVEDIRQTFLTQLKEFENTSKFILADILIDLDYLKQAEEVLNQLLDNIITPAEQALILSRLGLIKILQDNEKYSEYFIRAYKIAEKYREELPPENLESIVAEYLIALKLNNLKFSHKEERELVQILRENTVFYAFTLGLDYYLFRQQEHSSDLIDKLLFKVEEIFQYKTMGTLAQILRALTQKRDYKELLLIIKAAKEDYNSIPILERIFHKMEQALEKEQIDEFKTFLVKFFYYVI